MSELGRISGPMLEANLVRNGIDLAFENNLLYFDTATGRIGIRTEAPSHELTVSGITNFPTVDVDDSITIANINIDNDETISPIIGNVNITAPLVFVKEFLKLDNFIIKNNEINLSEQDTDFNFDADGTGEINFLKSVEISNDFIIEQDADIRGSVLFGSDNTNSVSINASVSSAIIPSENNQYNLGQPNLRWKTFESLEINGEDLSSVLIDVGGVDLGITQGNIFYVAINGTDQDDFPNSGKHQQAPWRTVKYALSKASAGDTVYIFPGEYQEELPLTVPAGVTVRGYDIRNTVVKPADGFQYQDVFLVDGETTISDITVKDFFYNNVDNIGYAFRFLLGGKVTTRSPYIQNVSVITRGSNITVEDPLSFDTNDAGRGAYIDGFEFDSTTNEASLLFHSATFITPGVDCIVMTNGVRVEWLNSFIYFANRGLVALQGTGRTVQSDSSLRFGAEIRSIGSANVYGNIGAYADGEDTLMYLINHNFAYIGSGKDSSNDKTLHIIENETQELNNGKIYFQSQAHDGNFRVGNVFFVDQATGKTSIDLTDIAIGGVARLTVSTNGNITVLDADFIETGNILFGSNTAISLTGDININSASGEINYLGNVNILQNLKINDNLLIEGSLIGFGDQTSDTITFESQVKEDVKPSQTEIFNLGSENLKWKTVWTSTTIIDQTKISGSTIETKANNATLEIKAQGTGNINLNETDVVFNQNLNVNDTFNTDNLIVNDNIVQTNNRTQTGDYNQTGNMNVTGLLTVSSAVEFEDILFDENNINAKTSDLIFKSTRNIVVDSNDVIVNQNLYVNEVDQIFDVQSAIITAQAAANEFYTDHIKVSSNIVETFIDNQDLVLQSTKNIVASNTDVEIENNLANNTTTYLKNSNVNSDIAHTGDRIQTGDYNQTGSIDADGSINISSDAEFNDVLFSENTIITTLTDQNLVLQADSLGEVESQVNLTIQQNLTVLGVASIEDLTVDNFVNSNFFRTDDIEIQNNQIETYTTNQDLVVQSATDNVKVEDTEINNNVIKSPGNDLIFTAVGKFILTKDNIVLPQGTTQEKTTFSIGDLRLDTTENVFEGYYTSRISFGGVYSDDKQTSVTAHPFDNELLFKIAGVEVGKIVNESDRSVILHGISSENNLIITDSQTLITTQDQFDSTLQNIELNRSHAGATVINESIEFKDSEFINLTNQPLTLRNTGTGYVFFNARSALAIPFGETVVTDDSSSPFIEIGDTRWNTDLEIMEVFDGVQYQPASGTGEVVTTEFMEDLTNEWTLILG